MRWPPWRRDARNGHAAREALTAAQTARKAATDLGGRVEEAVAAAEESARRADRFSRDVQRAMRLRRRQA